MATKVKADAASQKRESILFAAIGNFCAKRMIRSDLEPGKSYPIESEISGRIFRTDVKMPINGTLSVGHPTQYQTNSAAPAAEIVAVLLPLIPKSRRVDLLKSLAKTYSIDGQLPFSQADLNEAKVWLSSLKQLKPAKRSGAVSFRLEN